MAETVEDSSKPEVDTVEEAEGDGTMDDNSVTETDVVGSVSAAGDDGSVATDVNPSEPAAVDSTSTEEEQNAADESSAAEAAAVSQADAADESAVSSAAAAAAAADDNVAVVMLEAETDENKEVALPTPDEAVTAVSPSTGTVEEKPDESDKADVEASADVTTDRVEHVTCKADKVTVSVETSKTNEVSEGVETSSVYTTTVETKSEASDSGVAQSKTTQDVMNMAGNDELKFGVLIGLVRVGQLTNKDVVDSVLCLVSTFCSVNAVDKSACDDR